MFGWLCRLLCGLWGLSWLTRADRPHHDDPEVQRWRERRRAFRSKVRAAMAEFLSDEPHAGA